MDVVCDDIMNGIRVVTMNYFEYADCACKPYEQSSSLICRVGW